MKGQFPWIGRSRGSAGGMTTCKINDKNVMRAKAFEVTNPKTAAQVMQRDFFKQVQEVCASVTEDQLRSLFSVKPKTMTRRNALSKQIAAAYTITDGNKNVDFSKLGAIGNGEKVLCPMDHIIDETAEAFLYNMNMFPGVDPNVANLILVVFDVENNSIDLINTTTLFRAIDDDTLTAAVGSLPYTDAYVYVTCDSQGRNVSGESFGTFTIKTRATD